MDLRTLARLGALVLLVVAVMAAAFELRRDGAPKIAVTDTGRPESDPFATELLRCRDLGAAAANDLSCRKVWAENRRRFLGPSARPPASAAPDAPLAGDPPIPTKDQSQIKVPWPSGRSDAGDGDPQRRDAE